MSDKWFEREKGEKGKYEWVKDHPIATFIILSSLVLGILIVSVIADE